ncbi:MAG: hypothetical protein HC904_03005 [Blastochloris sp.]|nr:hypothetical protein [Blastochloris sp.]
MNVDRILQEFHNASVDCLLIGGMNFLLNHEPELTYDVDLWVRDEISNLSRVAQALVALEARWGTSEDTWGPVSLQAEWLQRQVVFCLTSPHGAIDIFRRVRGLEDSYARCHEQAHLQTTAGGVPYLSLSAKDMTSVNWLYPRGKENNGVLKSCADPYKHKSMLVEPSDLKAQEEKKRELAWDPAERWKVLQETITWAEAQLPPEQRRNRPRWHSAASEESSVTLNE